MIIDKKLVVWRFIDAKPGHEAQTKGLVDALGRLSELEVHDIVASSRLKAIVYWLLGRFPLGQDLPSPDYLLGAGHATHWPMLAARRAFGGRSVVLMRPSLPLAWFDYCVIPEHDNPPDRDNVISTIGVLNPIVYSPEKDRSKGLILLGGHSRHFSWDDTILKQQLKCLLSRNPEINWLLTTSRRTPATTLSMLNSLDSTKLQTVPHTETPSGWVARNLKDCAEVWVTPDSVSMLYEALTACERVGVLRTSTSQGKTRVAGAVEKLVSARRVLVLDSQEEKPERRPCVRYPLAEADRVAECMLNRTHQERRHADS